MSNPVDEVPYLGDFYAKLSALTDEKTGLPIATATVTVDLLTMGGQLVSGASGLVATYDPTTQAYWAVIPRTAGVQRGQHYRCRATATLGGLQVPFYREVVVEYFPA